MAHNTTDTQNRIDSLQNAAELFANVIAIHTENDIDIISKELSDIILEV